MRRIQQLTNDVVTQIAAGEVIERPSSVLKELLENSVDAGSTRIDVEVEEGGAELIRVVDNGGGIHPDDLELAFATHATSKLRSADDLFKIGTLGFRGEALASVGGVARVTLQSRPPELVYGAEIRCNGAELSPVRAWNGSPGTRVEVRSLFYNTPVRKKFLRTVSTELGHVCETFTRIALAHPSLHLTLRHNGKPLYEVPATAGLLDRVGLFFGTEVRDALYAVEAEQGPATLGGYVADPSCDRGNAKLQHLFVNGRWVRDRSVGHALQEAYRGLLMTGRYAAAFLFLDLPPDAVDVNVHPTKAEVRFRDGQAVYHMVRGTVRQRLSAANLTPKLQAPPGLEKRAEVVAQSAQPAPWELPPAASKAAAPVPAVAVPTSGGLPRGAADSHRGEPGGPSVGAPSTTRPPDHPTTQPGRALQLHDAYLVVETPEGMLVIDQHALHERILFEQLKARVKGGHLERQRLLIPEPVDFTVEQAARALEARQALAELGLEVEGFGGGTLLLHSYPAMLRRGTPDAILRTVVDFLGSKDRPPDREQLLDGLLSLMACKAAVKAGDRLTPEEVAALIDQRELALDTHHCPHGRPTSLFFSRHELDKQFGRI